MSRPLLEVTDLRKSFGGNLILDEIGFTVATGEVVGIIGPSGSGKSTLLRCLNYLERPDGGVIRMDGKLVGQKEVGGRMVPERESEILRYRAEVGMVFQSFNLFPHMTALQNIVEAPMSVRRLSRQDATARARDLLCRVRLEDKMGNYPHQLSGGEQQRVAIARALAMEPKLMLFDEVTSALDPELVGDVLQVIQDLAQNGMTMILVSHEMEFIRDVSSRVIFMSGGRIIEIQPPAAFFATPASQEARRFLGRMHAKAR